MDHLSASQITLYQLCSLKYRFKYIDRIPVSYKPSALAFGSSVHAALAWFHRQLVGGGNGVNKEKLLAIFEADWFAQNLDNRVRYKNGETSTSLAILGKEMLQLYFEHPEHRIQGAEVPFAVPIIGNNGDGQLPIGLEGYIDLIVEDDVIVEFKTSNQTMTQADAHEHMQLTAYSYAYQSLHGRIPKGLKIVDFVKNKRPKMVILKSQRTKTDHERFIALCHQVFKAIGRGVFMPRQSFMCRDCEYANHCQNWGNGKLKGSR